MTLLDEEMSDVRVPEGSLVMLQLASAGELKKVAPEILSEILELAAFFNYRRVENGGFPILVVSSYS